MEFLCDLASKIIKENEETHLSNKTYCQLHKVLISAKKNNGTLPNYHFLFFKKKAWTSHFSIFSGSRLLKFCKKGPIPSNVSIKLVASPDFITGVNLPPLKKPI